jgi:hypothetical protein
MTKTARKRPLRDYRRALRAGADEPACLEGLADRCDGRRRVSGNPSGHHPHHGRRDDAARVVAMAGPGETVVSSTVRDLVAGSGLRFEDRGRHALKGLPDEVQLYIALGV